MPAAERSAFEEAVACYHAASWPVLNDAAVWQEEAARRDAPSLQWPLPLPATQAARFFRLLALADVDVVIAILAARGDANTPALPLAGTDPRLQLVLRVVRRANLAGEQAVVALAAGDRLLGMRAYKNRALEAWTAAAARAARASGVTLEQTFAAWGIPRRQAFRARKRAVTRGRRRDV